MIRANYDKVYQIHGDRFHEFCLLVDTVPTVLAYRQERAWEYSISAQCHNAVKLDLDIEIVPNRVAGTSFPMEYLVGV
jgi:hypothetical protein